MSAGLGTVTGCSPSLLMTGSTRLLESGTDGKWMDLDPESDRTLELGSDRGSTAAAGGELITSKEHGIKDDLSILKPYKLSERV